MTSKVSDECRRIREALQDLHDAGKTPSGEIAAHLEGCPGCAAFQGFLGSLPRDLRDVLEETTARPPRYEELPDRPARVPFMSRRVAVPAIAAALVLALGIPSGFLAVSAMRERKATQKAVASFVEDLFRAPGREAASTAGTHAPSNEILDSLLDDLADAARKGSMD